MQKHGGLMNKYLALIFLGFFTLPAFGSLLIEPHLGYESSAVAANAISTPTVNDGYRTNGMSLGLRLGYKLPAILWIAGDIDRSTGAVTWADSTANTASVDFTRQDLYLVAGVDLPIFLRGWIGYGFSSNNELKQSSSSTTIKASGTALKLGLAFTSLPFINITGEVIMRTMKDFESGGATSSIDSVYSTYKDAGVRIGISIPLYL
jgi:hypothetical protein